MHIVLRHIREEWDTLREHDVIFLIRSGPKLPSSDVVPLDARTRHDSPLIKQRGVRVLNGSKDQ